MTTEVNIVPSEIKHCKQLAKDLRQKDRLEAERLGLDPEKAVFSAYRSAIYRCTALIDNQAAAMWGVKGTLFGSIGQPYFITGHLSETISPIKFARIYIQEVKHMNKLFPVLENYVDASYSESIRMLKIAGFEVDKPELFHGNLFCRFSR